MVVIVRFVRKFLQNPLDSCLGISSQFAENYIYKQTGPWLYWTVVTIPTGAWVCPWSLVRWFEICQVTPIQVTSGLFITTVALNMKKSPLGVLGFRLITKTRWWFQFKIAVRNVRHLPGWALRSRKLTWNPKIEVWKSDFQVPSVSLCRDVQTNLSVLFWCKFHNLLWDLIWE